MFQILQFAVKVNECAYLSNIYINQRYPIDSYGTIFKYIKNTFSKIVWACELN